MSQPRGTEIAFTVRDWGFSFIKRYGWYATINLGYKRYVIIDPHSFGNDKWDDPVDIDRSWWAYYNDRKDN
jgi:hypothetical protein